MITLQCTKKLATELEIPVSNEKLVTSEAIYCWHAHLFLFNRRKCVMVMNNEARYNFVMFGLIKKDFIRFNELILEQIYANLLADGLDKVLIDKYLQDHQQINYAPTSDRSILGQINDMILVAKFEMEGNMSDYKNPEIEQVNRYLNRFVFLKLPKLYSGETMHESLQNL